MQPSAHRIPESADGKQGNQGDDDNPADRENDSGPGQGKWTANIAVNKQFDAHAENGGFRKNIERRGDDGTGSFRMHSVRSSANMVARATIGTASSQNHLGELVR